MLSSVGFNFSSAKRGWFLDKINFLYKEKGVSKTEISGSLNIFKSRLSKIINDKNSIVQDSLVDSLISIYKFQNPINDSKAHQSFSKAKRNFFVSKISFLKTKKGLSHIDLCEIFGIFPSRLSYILNKPDTPINDKFIKDNIRWDTKLISAKDFKAWSFCPFVYIKIELLYEVFTIIDFSLVFSIDSSAFL